MNFPSLQAKHILMANVLVALFFWTFFGLVIFDERNTQTDFYQFSFAPSWEHKRQMFLSPVALVFGVVVAASLAYITLRLQPMPDRPVYELLRMVGLFVSVNYVNTLLLLAYFTP